MKKVKERLFDLSCIAIALLGMWLVVSTLNVISHNGLQDDHSYASWNCWQIYVNHRNNTANPTTSEKIAIYSDSDYNMLAHLINGEAGADYCSDELMVYVGSVALNRVAADDFPNTLDEVIHQPGQYACVSDGNYDLEPCQRAWEIAEELLVQGSQLPPNVIYQAEFVQGSKIFLKEQNMFFCCR